MGSNAESKLNVFNCCLAIANALDGLADLGITFIKIDNLMVLGSENLIEKLLNEILNNSSLISHIYSESETEKYNKITMIITLNSYSLKINESFLFYCKNRNNPKLKKKLYDDIKLNWEKMHDLIETIVVTLNLDLDPQWAEIRNRRSEYINMLNNIFL